MGVDLGPQGQGGKRSVDAELNLIPFIDLLSVCILFLLMTAVWVQIAKMSAFSSASGNTYVENSEVGSVNQGREDRDWDVLVRGAGVEVFQDGQRISNFKVEEAMEKIDSLKSKIKIPDAKVVLRVADEVPFENMITVLDALTNAKIVNITIGEI